MAGEALSYVQGESLKGSAAVFWRFITSPGHQPRWGPVSSRGESAMFFRRKPKPPLDEAARLAEEAVRLVHRYWHDRRYSQSAADLQAFRDLETRLFRSAAAARRIAIRMERRGAGEPETSARKWRR